MGSRPSRCCKGSSPRSADIAPAQAPGGALCSPPLIPLSCSLSASKLAAEEVDPYPPPDAEAGASTCASGWAGASTHPAAPEWVGASTQPAAPEWVGASTQPAAFSEHTAGPDPSPLGGLRSPTMASGPTHSSCALMAAMGCAAALAMYAAAFRLAALLPPPCGCGRSLRRQDQWALGGRGGS